MKTKSIGKLSAGSILYVDLLIFLNDIDRKSMFPKIIKLITHKFPLVRKSLGDKFLLFTMSQ